MDQFYEDLKKIGMRVEYELNQAVKEKLDDPELVETVKLWLELLQAVMCFIQLLSLAQALKE
ncbi:hypothetical protein NQ095_05475 [Rossellomorea sp. SC111]|uniref:hypothetical protein n=1 Tax=Rossellomorea sp. SC111 TaxID=2968985 RepID=UPI00215AB223|nr:hypothetical protein [Rossellomorea sp. SC111]MCR8847848.1 hypothetical protein [Rossellomorea sp. SC111]